MALTTWKPTVLALCLLASCGGDKSPQQRSVDDISGRSLGELRHLEPFQTYISIREALGHGEIDAAAQWHVDPAGFTKAMRGVRDRMGPDEFQAAQQGTLENLVAHSVASEGDQTLLVLRDDRGRYGTFFREDSEGKFKEFEPHGSNTAAHPSLLKALKSALH